MDIKGPNKPNYSQGNIGKPDDPNTITLQHLGQKINIDPKQISQACAEAAKLAFNIGETNDEEEYKREMEELLEEVLYEKAGKKPPKKKKPTP